MSILNLNKQENICTIIWDYDGTLFDTRQKNYNVTKRIVEKVKGNIKNFPVLNSVIDYYNSHLRATNWRDFYRYEFKLTEDEIDSAGRLWTEYQLNDNTIVPPIDDVDDVIRSLNQFQQGIVSQNSKENISRNLKENNLEPYIKSIIGYEEVDLKKQKPNPSGLIKCISRLCNSDSGNVFYIGDHETDLQTAKNANLYFEEKKTEIRVISIAAAYSECFHSNELINEFDFVAYKTADVLEITCEYDL